MRTNEHQQLEFLLEIALWFETHLASPDTDGGELLAGRGGNGESEGEDVIDQGNTLGV